MRKNSLLSALIECIYPPTVSGIILEPKLFENKVNEVDEKIIEINTTKDNFVSSINTKVDNKISEISTRISTRNNRGKVR